MYFDTSQWKMSDRTQNRNFALQIRYTVTNTTYTMEQSPGKANSS